MLDNLKDGDLVKLDIEKIAQHLEYISEDDLNEIRRFYPEEFREIHSRASTNTDTNIKYPLKWLFKYFLETNAVFPGTSEKLSQRMPKLIEKNKLDFQFYLYWQYYKNDISVNFASNNLLEMFKNQGVIGSLGGGNGNENWMLLNSTQVRPMRENWFPIPMQFLEPTVSPLQEQIPMVRQLRNLDRPMPAPLINLRPINLVALSSTFKLSNVYHITKKCKWKTNRCHDLECKPHLCHTKKTREYMNIGNSYKICDSIYPTGDFGTEKNYYLSFLSLFSELKEGKLKAGDVVLLNESIGTASIDYPCSFNVAINDMIEYLAKKKISVVLCAGNTGKNLSDYNYPSLASKAIVVGAIKKTDNRWQFDSNFASGTEIDFYVQTHEGFFSQSSAASAFVARKIKEIQDSIRSNQEEDKLSVDEIKVRLRQEAELNIINGAGIMFFASDATAAL